MHQSKPPLTTEAELDDAILCYLKAHPLERVTPMLLALELDKSYEVSGEIYDGNDGRLPAIVEYKRATDRGGVLAVNESLMRLSGLHPLNVIFESESEMFYWKD